MSSSFDNSTSPKAAGALICGAVMTALAGLVMISRLVTRFVFVKSPGLEDAFILLAWLTALVYLITLGLMSRYGFGRQSSDLPADEFKMFLAWFWASMWVYNMSLTATKLSLLFQYKRVFSTKKFQIAVKIELVIIAIYGLWTIVGTALVCVPVASYWNNDIKGHCLSRWPIYFNNSLLNILTDLMLILSPMPVLRKLQMPRRQKSILIGLFAIGGFVCIISIIRLVLLTRILDNDNLTVRYVGPSIWTTLEVTLAIITCSVPTLKPLFSRYFGHGISSHTKPTVTDTVRGTFDRHDNFQLSRLVPSRKGDDVIVDEECLQESAISNDTKVFNVDPHTEVSDLSSDIRPEPKNSL